jgi:hypothetical protein
MEPVTGIEPATGAIQRAPPTTGTGPGVATIPVLVRLTLAEYAMSVANVNHSVVAYFAEAIDTVAVILYYSVELAHS